MADIRFVQADTLKEKPADVSKVGFGRVFTDYMFEMDYNHFQLNFGIKMWTFSSRSRTSTHRASTAN